MSYSQKIQNLGMIRKKVRNFRVMRLHKTKSVKNQYPTAGNIKEITFVF